MILSTLRPGDLVREPEGDRYRVIAHGIELDADRGLPPATLKRLGLRYGLGNGSGSQGKVPLIGRGYKLTGTLAARCNNDPGADDPDHLALLVSGHDLITEDQFLRRWARHNTMLVETHGRHDEAARLASLVAIANPRPIVDRRYTRGITSTTPWGGAQLLYDGPLAFIAAYRSDPPEDVNATWLGEPGPRPVLVETPTGERHLVQGRLLVRDRGQTELRDIRARQAEAATIDHRTRIRDALKAVANDIDADPRHVFVNLDVVGLPLTVLLALLSGAPHAEHATAALFEGADFIRDSLHDLEANRQERRP